MSTEVKHLAEQLFQLLTASRLKLVTAESCTAGLLARQLADTPGAGECFHGGFVTYSKDHKSRALAVPADLLRAKGAVCGEVARAMAEGALQHSTADLSAAITGVAGPEPDEDGNPVGRVCIAVARRGGPTRDFERHYPTHERGCIRRRAINDALNALIAAAGAHPEVAEPSEG